MAIADVDPIPGFSGSPWRLGRYLALRRLAVGGMAELILAEVTGAGDFRKVVALKRLLPQHALDPQMRQMFLDEARLMARMSHPHIPQVYDVCATHAAFDQPGAQLPYFIMEYVHGRDLRAVLSAAEGPLPLAVVVAVGAAVASGLHHAHELRGETGALLEVVHRDVSPSNVLLSFDGVVKLTDFGVAKWRQQRSSTVEGQLKGKLAHMSPEQCFGHALDRRSDVFALGTLLYEMAFGQPAFAADGDYELMSRVVRGEVCVPAGDRAAVPAPLSEIIRRTLARSRDERYPTAQAVQVELERFARARALTISPIETQADLEVLFGARVTEWRAAVQSGQSLADHLREPAAVAEARGWGKAGDSARGGGALPGRAAPDRTVTDPAQPSPGAASRVPTVAGSRGSGRAAVVVVGALGLAGLTGLFIAGARSLTSAWGTSGGLDSARSASAPEARAGSGQPSAPPAVAAGGQGPAQSRALTSLVEASARAPEAPLVADPPPSSAPSPSPSSSSSSSPSSSSSSSRAAGERPGLARGRWGGGERSLSASTRKAPPSSPRWPAPPSPRAAAIVTTALGPTDVVLDPAPAPAPEGPARATSSGPSAGPTSEAPPPRPEVRVWDPDSPVPP